MGVQILAGSKAVYLGPGKTEPWKFREGIECVVTEDTLLDCSNIPVVFECEDKEVKPMLGHLLFTECRTRKFDLK